LFYSENRDILHECKVKLQWFRIQTLLSGAAPVGCAGKEIEEIDHYA
jgi:hypothetical protein